MSKKQQKTGQYKERPVFVEYIKEWCKAFPEDREKLITIFVNMTAGATMSPEIADCNEKAAFYGFKGDLEKFTDLMKEYIAEIDKLVAAACYNDDSLSDNIGPELWVEN